jgi:hypothetical protein
MRTHRSSDTCRPTGQWSALPDLRSEVELELTQLEQLQKTYTGAFDRAKAGEPDEDTIVVLATALHSLYNGAENAIKRILREVDKIVPSGVASHTELLIQASSANVHRPAVISESLHEQLEPLMAFRHFFRHAYAFQFEWDKMAEHVGNFDHVVQSLRKELLGFLDQLERGP